MSDDDAEPLADLAAAVSHRREEHEGDDDAFAAFEDAGAEVDSEAVWATLTGGESAGAERVVDTQTYCHRCPHFAGPPEMACTHEGTGRVELVDGEHARARNRPVVAEREELEGAE